MNGLDVRRAYVSVHFETSPHMQSLFPTSRLARRATQWLSATQLSDVLLIANTALSTTLGLALAPFLGTLHTLICTSVVWLNGLVILFGLMAWHERRSDR